MNDLISGGVTDKAIGLALNGLAVRQKVISDNLANVDTPGFKGSEVRFEDALQSALSQGGSKNSLRLVASNPLHLNPEPATLQGIRPQVVQINNTTNRLDGNNVDIDKEMVQLAETTLTYNALVQSIASRLALTKYIISEGRR